MIQKYDNYFIVIKIIIFDLFIKWDSKRSDKIKNKLDFILWFKNSLWIYGLRQWWFTEQKRCMIFIFNIDRTLFREIRNGYWFLRYWFFILLHEWKKLWKYNIYEFFTKIDTNYSH